RIGSHSQGPIVDLSVRQTGDALHRTDFETRWMNPQSPREALHRFGKCRAVLFAVQNDAVLFVYSRHGPHGRQQLLHVVQADAPSEELDEARHAPSDIKKPLIVLITQIAVAS